MKRLTALIFAIVSLAACGDDDAGTNAVTGGVVRYQLVGASHPSLPQRSTLFHQNTKTTPPGQYTLGGTFDVVAAIPPPANTLFAFHIIRVDFSEVGTANPVRIQGQGDAGSISATTLDPDQPLRITLKVTVFGQQVELAGSGSPDTFTTDIPPSFNAVGAGFTQEPYGPVYRLTIFAVPEGS
jgi:hypothetical protein